MQTSNNDEFARLSARCRMHTKAGMLDWFAYDLKTMGALFGREGKHEDKLKVLLLAFYIDLCGVNCRPFIDRAVLVSIEHTVPHTGLSKHEIQQLYLDTVRADVTPRHIMTVKDSLYLLELCMDCKEDEANEILQGIIMRDAVER